MSFPTYYNCYSNVITNVTNANPGVVTTASNHGYSNGLYVRLVIPNGFGMGQANGNVYLITVLSPTTFSLNVDTSNFAPFNLISSLQVPQVIPVGEVSNTLLNAEINNRNIIPQSTDNTN